MTEEQERVLVVDDEDSVREFLKRILGNSGYNVITAASGQEALEKISQFKTKLVFLDIKMPGISGMEVLQEITANWHDTCVIMVTAMGTTETAVEAMKLGAYDYITKPFNGDDLILKTQKALRERDLQLESKRHLLDLEQRVAEQAEQLQQQFVELVETLAREHKLIYNLAHRQQKDSKALLSKLPPELQKPMSSTEEFSEALLKILRRRMTGAS